MNSKTTQPPTVETVIETLKGAGLPSMTSEQVVELFKNSNVFDTSNLINKKYCHYVRFDSRIIVDMTETHNQVYKYDRSFFGILRLSDKETKLTPNNIPLIALYLSERLDKEFSACDPHSLADFERTIEFLYSNVPELRQNLGLGEDRQGELLNVLLHTVTSGKSWDITDDALETLAMGFSDRIAIHFATEGINSQDYANFVLVPEQMMFHCMA